jgi:hypothetical protein
MTVRVGWGERACAAFLNYITLHTFAFHNIHYVLVSIEYKTCQRHTITVHLKTIYSTYKTNNVKYNINKYTTYIN